jgi:prevent-host-death family protein
MTITTAKARLLAIVDEVEQGAEVELTRHGRVVARLVPPKGPRSMRGALAGQAVSVADEDDLFSPGEAWDMS